MSSVKVDEDLVSTTSSKVTAAKTEAESINGLLDTLKNEALKEVDEG